ncbi:MAG: DUF5063 domain-containing protein [Marinifilaceae bacterium]|jgi:hypothetical protein|nr:DUF5063 domain-containing protein [Marinifilaceae bacterium]
MEDNTFDSVAYDKNTLEFVKVANEYCQFLENSKSIELSGFVDIARKIMSLLYLKACMLPNVNPMLDEEPEKFVNESDWGYINNILREKLGEQDEYLEVFNDEMQFSEEARSCSISENMTDIYQDIKDFISAYRIGNTEIMNDALWAVKDSFSLYWGQYLVNSLRAIHNLSVGDRY